MKKLADLTYTSNVIQLRWVKCYKRSGEEEYMVIITWHISFKVRGNELLIGFTYRQMLRTDCHSLPQYRSQHQQGNHCRMVH